MSQLEVLEPPPTEESEGSKFAKAHHILLYFVAAVVVVWLLTGFYKVNADEVAIVERLGKYISTPEGKAVQVEQGLHYAMPWPIDVVHKISIQQTFTLRVNAFDTSPAEYNEMKQVLLMQRNPPEVISAVFDPYLITADKSIVHMDVSVVYRINDPEAWLTTISHSGGSRTEGSDEADLRQQFFQQIVQHTIVCEISRMSMQSVLFTDLQALPGTLMTALEKSMGFPEPGTGTMKSLGVQIQKVDVVRVRPPDFVKEAFNQVIQARLQRDTRISGARADFDASVTRAKGEQTTLVLDAETYRKQTTEAARGESNRFRELLVQFNNAPDLTRWNVFVDAVRSVSRNAKRIYFAERGQRFTVIIDPPEFDAGQAQQGK